MFGCSGTQIYDPGVGDEDSCQPWDNDRAIVISGVATPGQLRALPGFALHSARVAQATDILEKIINYLKEFYMVTDLNWFWFIIVID